ncbi:tail fiber domain-containing protein [Burkholderia sp. MS455]|uniref:tail fiber domain-containing protein n=1 Tax=Burkholderia sp. MS455 TaxID=2811788 RepID=UPI00195E2D33|nr:tail fiber domain-containing protein [Burkholderia sp. MS455]QRR06423.1 tail fiber domain-containing protein [Burkholderia sp. MS455]
MLLVINASGFAITHSPSPGDSFANPVALGAYETLLAATDGANSWSVLMRGRSAGPNEQVSGNLAVSGSVSCSAASVSAATGGVNLSIGAAAGNYRQVLYNSGTSLRWANGVTSASENGSNAGSDFFISRYSDNGTWIDAPLQISRATGAAAFSKRPTFSGYVAWDSGNFNPAGYLPLSGGALNGNLYCPAVIVNNGIPYYAKDSNGVAQPLISISPDNFPTLYNPFGTHMRIVNRAYNRELFSCDDNGNVTIGGTLTQGSDARFKADVETINNALHRLCEVRGVEYRYRDTDQRQYGVIAQEVQQAFPYAVTELPDSFDKSGYLGVNYTSLIGPIIEAVKELASRVSALEQTSA